MHDIRFRQQPQHLQVVDYLVGGAMLQRLLQVAVFSAEVVAPILQPLVVVSSAETPTRQTTQHPHRPLGLYLAVEILRTTRLSLAACSAEELQQEVGNQPGLCLAEMQGRRQVVQGLQREETQGLGLPLQAVCSVEASLERNLQIQMLLQVRPNRRDHVRGTIALSAFPTKTSIIVFGAPLTANTNTPGTSAPATGQPTIV